MKILVFYKETKEEFLYGFDSIRIQGFHVIQYDTRFTKTKWIQLPVIQPGSPLMYKFSIT